MTKASKKQLRDVVIVVGETRIADDGSAYAISTLIRVDWQGTVVELENLLSRSKRVVHMERLKAVENAE